MVTNRIIGSPLGNSIIVNPRRAGATRRWHAHQSDHNSALLNRSQMHLMRINKSGLNITDAAPLLELGQTSGLTNVSAGSGGLAFLANPVSKPRNWFETWLRGTSCRKSKITATNMVPGPQPARRNLVHLVPERYRAPDNPDQLIRAVVHNPKNLSLTPACQRSFQQKQTETITSVSLQIYVLLVLTENSIKATSMFLYSPKEPVPRKATFANNYHMHNPCTSHHSLRSCHGH
mmetsp:Transcript_106284/g.243334  ORF Transcript_106284/g.243334 Transcript_106284/m.243334 type:complete len:233 (-) Transcript_106284:15-713(-)